MQAIPCRGLSQDLSGWQVALLLAGRDGGTPFTEVGGRGETPGPTGFMWGHVPAVLPQIAIAGQGTP